MTAILRITGTANTCELRRTDPRFPTSNVHTYSDESQAQAELKEARRVSVERRSPLSSRDREPRRVHQFVTKLTTGKSLGHYGSRLRASATLLSRRLRTRRDSRVYERQRVNRRRSGVWLNISSGVVIARAREDEQRRF